MQICEVDPLQAFNPFLAYCFVWGRCSSRTMLRSTHGFSSPNFFSSPAVSAWWPGRWLLTRPTTLSQFPRRRWPSPLPSFGSCDQGGGCTFGYFSHSRVSSLGHRSLSDTGQRHTEGSHTRDCAENASHSIWRVCSTVLHSHRRSEGKLPVVTQKSY